MKYATMTWDKPCEDALDQIVELFRKSIVANAEDLAKSLSVDKVSSHELEIALYNSVATLNECNKANIFECFGPMLAIEIINKLEEVATCDVSLAVLEQLIKEYDDLPEETKKMVDELKKRLGYSSEEET